MRIPRARTRQRLVLAIAGSTVPTLVATAVGRHQRASSNSRRVASAETGAGLVCVVVRQRPGESRTTTQRRKSDQGLGRHRGDVTGRTCRGFRRQATKTSPRTAEATCRYLPAPATICRSPERSAPAGELTAEGQSGVRSTTEWSGVTIVRSGLVRADHLGLTHAPIRDSP